MIWFFFGIAALVVINLFVLHYVVLRLVKTVRFHNLVLQKVVNDLQNHNISFDKAAKILEIHTGTLREHTDDLIFIFRYLDKDKDKKYAKS